jgi:glycosyltransferase involved in cell wall biosynthesis
MKRLVFVSPRFLFPVDSGGKIRTTQILRGLKDTEYEVTLVSPATKSDLEKYSDDMGEICSRFESWPAETSRSGLARVRHIFSPLPIPIRTDQSAVGAELVARLLRESKPDVAVFDFLHACVLVPKQLDIPSVLFTHNVESQIFSRHRDVTSNPFARWLWSSQLRKMRRFEADSVPKFDVVVAVSPNDGSLLASRFGAGRVRCIPTSVDLDRHRYVAPSDSRHIVFVGSMDWLANQDGVRFFMDEVWSRIVDVVPDARMTVVGRSPPSGLVRRASARGLKWTFTGYVDDVRSHVSSAAVSVVPLRIGGGTRLKVYESMASGCPIVSTTIGVEGLSVIDGEHYLRADTADAFARCVTELMLDDRRRIKMAETARDYVDVNFGIEAAAREFAAACDEAILMRATTRVTSGPP